MMIKDRRIFTNIKGWSS